MLAGVQRTSGSMPLAVDAVFDSVSIGTTFRDNLAKEGVIFCSFSEAVQEYPKLVREYLGRVVPKSDNFYAALNFGSVQRWLVRIRT